jgi:membrane-associated phospholipid phosphatase
MYQGIPKRLEALCISYNPDIIGQPSLCLYVWNESNKLRMYLMQLRRLTVAHKWFVMALLLLGVFAIFTFIFSTGILLYPTLYAERWLLHRPVTGIDCVFDKWKQLGEVGFSLFFTLVLGVVCLLLGYRRRILPLLFCLLLLGVGAEYVGKQIFPQTIPINTQFGTPSLDCPQSGRETRSERLMLAMGMWWKAPLIHTNGIQAEQYSANAPFVFDENAVVVYGYPSGHAIRWIFLGIIACWLVWRHLRKRVLRVLLMALALAIAFGGGFLQFYIGVHLATDLVGGYLLGGSLACCAIGLLLLNKPNKRRLSSPVPPSPVEQVSIKGV